MSKKKSMMEYMKERANPPINPSVYKNVASGYKQPKFDSYAFGSGGIKQSEVGGGVSMKIGKRGSVSASGFRGKDEYGKFSNYEIKGGISIPINRSKKKKN
jgi:hypothetical protein